MLKNVVYLKDVIGQPYVGVKFSINEIQPILEVWSSLFDKDIDTHLILTTNRIKRDGEYFHITLFNSMEWKSLLVSTPKEKIKSIFTKEIDDIIFEGIGKAIKDGNEAYFIVVSSDKLNKIRKSFGLEDKDLHVTLGFNRKDVHGVSKGIDTIIKFVK